MTTESNTTTQENTAPKTFDSLKAEDFTFGTAPVKPPVAPPTGNANPINTPPLTSNEGGKEPVTPPANAEGAKTTPEPNIQNASPNPTNTPPAPLEIDDHQFGDLLSDATKGAITSVDKIFELVEENKRLRELQQNPENFFDSPEKKKIYGFLSKYHGSDYEMGIQTYARLASLDMTKMAPLDILKESFLMEQSRLGTSREIAEKMFQIEFDEKYASKGELSDAYIKADSVEARRKIEAVKNELSMPKVDDQQAEQEQRMQKAQEGYVKSVAAALDGYKVLTLGNLTDKQENDFNFEIEDLKPISDAMYDYQNFFNSRYVTPEKTVNTELLAMDLTRILYQEKIDKMLFEHGTNVGKEMEIAKRNNIGTPSDKAASNLTGGGSGSQPKDVWDAISNHSKITPVFK